MEGPAHDHSRTAQAFRWREPDGGRRRSARGEYGDRVVRVEPGGAEFVPLGDRHGSPIHLLWTWMSPNLEFATIFLGVLAVAAFGLTFWQAVLAIVVGTGLGALGHAVLSARGPGFGVPQMILSRVPFGFLGNLLPAGLNVITAGVGWFAVNSVSGALALTALTDLPAVVSLVIVVIVMVVIGFFGHNLISAWERYILPLLAIVFLIVAVIILTKASPSAAPGGDRRLPARRRNLLRVHRRLEPVRDRLHPLSEAGQRPLSRDLRRAGRFRGRRWTRDSRGRLGDDLGGGLDGNPTVAFTDTLPSALVGVTLLCIVVGGISANVINIYSGTMSFLAMGIRLPLTLRRAIVALVFGVLGGCSPTSDWPTQARSTLASYWSSPIGWRPGWGSTSPTWCCVGVSGSMASCSTGGTTRWPVGWPWGSAWWSPLCCSPTSRSTSVWWPSRSRRWVTSPSWSGSCSVP